MTFANNILSESVLGGNNRAYNAWFSSSFLDKCLLCSVDSREIYGNDRYYVFLETYALYAILRDLIYDTLKFLFLFPSKKSLKTKSKVCLT